jgi:hypothetical protein
LPAWLVINESPETGGISPASKAAKKILDEAILCFYEPIYAHLKPQYLSGLNVDLFPLFLFPVP